MPVTDQELQAAVEDLKAMASYFVDVAEPFLQKYHAVIPLQVAAAFSNLREARMHYYNLRKQRAAERNPHA